MLDENVKGNKIIKRKAETEFAYDLKKRRLNDFTIDDWFDSLFIFLWFFNKMNLKKVLIFPFFDRDTYYVDKK